MSFSNQDKMFIAIAVILAITVILFALSSTGLLPCSRKEKFEPLTPNSTPNSTMLMNDDVHEVNEVLERPNPPPVEYVHDVSETQPENDLLPVSGTDESAFEFTPQNLQDINFLDTADRIGLDTISNTLKNANYSIRPDPMIPKTEVSPWMNSEIDADPIRNNKALI